MLIFCIKRTSDLIIVTSTVNHERMNSSGGYNVNRNAEDLIKRPKEKKDQCVEKSSFDAAYI